MFPGTHIIGNFVTSRLQLSGTVDNGINGSKHGIPWIVPNGLGTTLWSSRDSSGGTTVWKLCNGKQR